MKGPYEYCPGTFNYGNGAATVCDVEDKGYQ